MSANKQTVERFMDGFNKIDHAQILSCLTDDVEWIIPGAFRVVGKAAFDQQIEGNAFDGNPIVSTTRMVEADDVVIAEGNVKQKRTDGDVLQGVFCDVFVMENAKIKQLTSYLVELS